MATDYIINPDRIQAYFSEIETRKNLLTSITDLHKTLTSHFNSLSQTLAEKSQQLDSEIASFTSQSKKSLELLENRENAIPERESAAAARIEEQKALAISDFEDPDENLGRSLPELLKMFCRRMDSGGLLKFMLVKRKESAALRAELASALEEAMDSLGLALEAVEDFLKMKVEGRVGLADRRWACGLLIQAAVPMQDGTLELLVGRSLKERAVAVLQKWKGLLGGGEGSGGTGAGEATMFLQIVSGFGLREKFDEEFLRKLVLEFAGRRDMAKLATALGFTGDKMRDMIDELVKSGKEIEAVYFASEFGLTERFAPISLLKSYLKNCRKNANSISKNGKYSAAAVEEANSSELNATKAIIKCVEDHKLESEFAIDSLKKRVTQLERAKADNKKKSAPSTSRPSNKRAHGGSSKSGRRDGPSFRPPKAGRFSNTSPALRQRNPPQLHQAPAARFAPPYNYPSATVYDGPGTPSYVAGYGGPRTQSPVGLQHAYPAPDVGAAGVRPVESYVGQGSYGAQAHYAAYDYPSAPAYPPTYQQ